MIAYILNYSDLSLKGKVEFEIYNVEKDINYSGKTSITVVKKPNAEKHDIFYVKDLICGKLSNVANDGESSKYVLTMIEIENIFDRKLILLNDINLSTTSLETYIKNTIENEFSQSPDTMMNLDYLTVTKTTDTFVSKTVLAETDKGIFNFKTLLANWKENYDIYTDFTLNKGSLIINVYRKIFDSKVIDCNSSDILPMSYKENLSEEPVARVDILCVENNTVYRYYLLSDHTTTTDSTNVNRAFGTVETITVQNLDEVENQAITIFRNNLFKHSLEFSIINTSRLYPPSQYFVGAKIKVKTKNGTIHNTFIYGISKTGDQDYTNLKCGNLAVRFTQKMKERMRGS